MKWLYISTLFAKVLDAPIWQNQLLIMTCVVIAYFQTPRIPIVVHIEAPIHLAGAEVKGLPHEREDIFPGTVEQNNVTHSYSS